MQNITIKHKKDGTPYIRLYLGRNRYTGKLIQPYREFPGMTDEEAYAAAYAWARSFGTTYAGGVSDRLSDRLQLYLEYLEADGRSHNTVSTYGTFVGYCAPIANLNVGDVTPMILNDLYVELLKHGAHGTPLSHATVHSFRMFLQGAFRHFVTIGLIEHNPVGDSMRIHATRSEPQALDEASLRLVNAYITEIISSTADNNASIARRNAVFAIYLALYTGARIGEICALRRCDIRFISRTMSINGTVVDTKQGPKRQDRTKGKKSRNIAILERNVKPLRDHIGWQVGYLEPVSYKTPIITTDGTYTSPNAISKAFVRMRDELGLDPCYHLHTLRHTHATWLLQSGYDMRTIQERLGHARVDTTLALYGHVMPGRDEQAAEGFGHVIDEISAI